jgi:hypothetical protein
LQDWAIAIGRFYAVRDVSQPVGWRWARTRWRLEDSLQDLVERGVTSITTYYEAGESDEAFAALRLEAAALANAAARLEQGCVASGDLFLATVRTKVELMYGATTAERLIVAFNCGCGSAGRSRSRRT